MLKTSFFGLNHSIDLLRTKMWIIKQKTKKLNKNSKFIVVVVFVNQKQLSKQVLIKK